MSYTKVLEASVLPKVGKGRPKGTLDWEMAKMLPLAVQYMRGVLKGEIQKVNSSRLGASKWIIELYLHKDGKGSSSFEALILGGKK